MPMVLESDDEDKENDALLEKVSLNNIWKFVHNIILSIGKVEWGRY